MEQEAGGWGIRRYTYVLYNIKKVKATGGEPVYGVITNIPAS